MRQVAIIGGLALACSASGAWAAPRISFISNTTYDFKTVYQGTQVAYGFFFKNTGDKTLVIDDLVKSCGCTTARAVPEKIAPGAKGKISVTFDTSLYPGKQYKTVYVATNDPDHQNITLAMSGNVKTAVKIDPDLHVTFKQITTKDKKSETRTVIPLENKVGFKITKIDSPVPYIRVSAPRRSGKAQGAFDITITIGPGAPVGRVGQEIKIHTTSKNQPVATIRVFANVVAAK